MNNKLLVGGGMFCDLEEIFEYVNHNILLTVSGGIPNLQ
jgi:hypothetical protein